MLDSIYHMTLRLLCNIISGVKEIRICHYVRKVCYGHHNVSENLLTTSGLSILMHDVISLLDAASCDKNKVILISDISVFDGNIHLSRDM